MLSKAIINLLASVLQVFLRVMEESCNLAVFLLEVLQLCCQFFLSILVDADGATKLLVFEAEGFSFALEVTYLTTSKLVAELFINVNDYSPSGKILSTRSFRKHRMKVERNSDTVFHINLSGAWKEFASLLA